jgi:para-aminobenzoate synthetase component I
MISDFPYTLIDRERIIERMNALSKAHLPFIFLINYKADKGYVVPFEELDENFIKFDFSSESVHNESDITNFSWEINPLDYSSFALKFEQVVGQIKRGNSFLTNLTQPTKVATSLSLVDYYNQGQAKYKLWLKDQFVVLSPETFVKISDGKIHSFPMKGTIDATLPNAEEQLLNDHKEKAEHATIVDLIRNDLSMVANDVEVRRYRYIDTIHTHRGSLLQVSSEIEGHLPEDYLSHLGDVLFAMLPAGSICGAPKTKTLEIIEQVEGYNRGFYTGVCGCFDGKSLDSAVMIRFLEQTYEGLIFKSGGGITAQSDVKKEYNELIQKIYVPIR